MVIKDSNTDINILVLGSGLWLACGPSRAGLGLTAINDLSLSVGPWPSCVGPGPLALCDLVLLKGWCTTRLYLGLLTIDDLVLLWFAINDLVLVPCDTLAVSSHHVIAFFGPCAARAL